MLDSVSLDHSHVHRRSQQRQIFCCVAIAPRAIGGGRTVRNLGDQIGVLSSIAPAATPNSTLRVVLLSDARSIVTGVDLLEALPKGMAIGSEPELSLVVDVFYAIDAITEVAEDFHRESGYRSRCVRRSHLVHDSIRS